MIRCIFADRSQDFPSEKFTSSAYNNLTGPPSHPSKIDIFCKGPLGPPGLSRSSSQKRSFLIGAPQAPGPPSILPKRSFCSGPPGPPLATLSKNGLFVEGDPSGPQAFPSHPSNIGIFVGGPRAPPLTFPKIGLFFVVVPRGPRAPPLLLSQKKAFFCRELLVKRSFFKDFQ